MPSFIISYDLAKDGDYTKLYEKIKSYGTWGRIVESTWIIKSESSCINIRDDLWSCMKSDDRLIVVQTASIAAWSNVICTNDWLANNA